MCINWRRIRLSNAAEQVTNADCHKQQAKNRCPGQYWMSLYPYGYPAPCESLLLLSLGLRLVEQFAVALEARRTGGQVFCNCRLAPCRVKSKRPESSVRGASLALRVRKSLREIRARKVEQVLALSLKAPVVFEIHFHRSQPLRNLSRFISHFSGQASRQSCAALD